jgi:hypothetical protein
MEYGHTRFRLALRSLSIITLLVWLSAPTPALADTAPEVEPHDVQSLLRGEALGDAKTEGYKALFMVAVKAIQDNAPAKDKGNAFLALWNKIQSLDEKPKLKDLVATIAGKIDGPNREPAKLEAAALISALFESDTPEGIQKLIDQMMEKGSPEAVAKAAATRTILDTLINDPQNKPWVDFLRGIQDGAITSHKALKLLIERRKALAEGKDDILAMKLAEERYSLSIKARGLMPGLLKEDGTAQKLEISTVQPFKLPQPAKAGDEELLTWVKATYDLDGGTFGLVGEKIEKLKAELTIARNAAEDWNNARTKFFVDNPPAEKVTIRGRDGDREVTAAEWVQQNKDTIGEDALIRFAAARESVVGDSVFRSLGGPGAKEVPTLLMTIPPGVTEQSRSGETLMAFDAKGENGPSYQAYMILSPTNSTKSDFVRLSVAPPEKIVSGADAAIYRGGKVETRKFGVLNDPSAIPLGERRPAQAQTKAPFEIAFNVGAPTSAAPTGSDVKLVPIAGMAAITPGLTSETLLTAMTKPDAVALKLGRDSAGYDVAVIGYDGENFILGQLKEGEPVQYLKVSRTAIGAYLPKAAP